jgi:hypothetical protein
MLFITRLRPSAADAHYFRLAAPPMPPPIFSPARAPSLLSPSFHEDFRRRRLDTAVRDISIRRQRCRLRHAIILRRHCRHALFRRAITPPQLAFRQLRCLP